VLGCHPYVGNELIDVPQTNLTCIEIIGGFGQTISGNYIDKGAVIMRGVFDVIFTNNRFLFSVTPENDSCVILDAVNVVNQGIPPRLLMHSNYMPNPVLDGSMRFLKLIASGTGSWTAAATVIGDLAASADTGVSTRGLHEATQVVDGVNWWVRTGTGLTSRISMAGDGFAQIVEMWWESGQFVIGGTGIDLRVCASGEFTTSSIRIEGSRIADGSLSGTLMFHDRGGVVRETLSESADRVWKIDHVSSPLGNPTKLVLRQKQGGTMTYTDRFAFEIGRLRIGTMSIIVGTGSPEGAVVGIVGDQFMRQNGGAGTTLYIKESGTGNTGWVAK
jgi:hypothetical protein